MTPTNQLKPCPDEPPECPICGKPYFFGWCIECGYEETKEEDNHDRK